VRAFNLILVTTKATAAITITNRLRHARYRRGWKDRLCGVDIEGVRKKVPSWRRTVVRERPAPKRWNDRIFVRPLCASIFLLGLLAKADGRNSLYLSTQHLSNSSFGPSLDSVNQSSQTLAVMILHINRAVPWWMPPCGGSPSSADSSRRRDEL